MLIIKSWPDEIAAIPKSLATAIKNHLVLPFDGSEFDAKGFWQICPCTLIIVTHYSSLLTLYEDEQALFEFGLSYAEYQECVIEGYQIMMAVLSDDGAGIYLVYPNNFDFKHLKASI
jgi:hypothetical protein